MSAKLGEVQLDPYITYFKNRGSLQWRLLMIRRFREFLRKAEADHWRHKRETLTKDEIRRRRVLGLWIVAIGQIAVLVYWYFFSGRL